jgi:APA family basic amino acid/polyamine antiporter
MLGPNAARSLMPPTPTLLRSLGFVATCAIVVSNMIGQGVFLKARVMTCDVGSAGVMLVAWVVAGGLALCGALTLAELTAAIPESGGIYAFLRRAYGRAFAFAYGWMALFIGGPSATAALAVGGAIFFNLASGGVLDAFTLRHLGGTPLSVSGMQLAAIGLIAVMTLVNCAPAVVNGQIATGSAVFKIAMLVGVTVAAAAIGHAGTVPVDQTVGTASCAGVPAASRGGVAGFAAALIGALYAYQGWQSATLVAGEVKNPGRIFPLALGASVTLVIGCYVAGNIAFVHVLGAHAIANLPAGASVGVTVVETLFGPVWRVIAAGLLSASVIATLHVTILSNARIIYALAHDQAGFAFVGGLSARARVPVRALVANGIIAALLVAIGSFDTLSDYLVFNSWVFFIAAAGAVFVLRRREPGLARPYRTPAYPFVPALFIVVAVWLLVQTLVSNPRNSLIGLVIVALSLPAYLLLNRRRAAPAAPLPSGAGGGRGGR